MSLSKSFLGQDNLDEVLSQFFGLKDLVAKNLTLALDNVERVYCEYTINNGDEFFELIKDFLSSFVLMWAGCKKEYRMIASEEKILFCILLLLVSCAKIRYTMLDQQEQKKLWQEIEKLIS